LIIEHKKRCSFNAAKLSKGEIAFPKGSLNGTAICIFGHKKTTCLGGEFPPLKSFAMQTYERFFGFEAKGKGKIMPEEFLGDSSKIEP
jgi:hypothetical protein